MMTDDNDDDDDDDDDDEDDGNNDKKLLTTISIYIYTYTDTFMHRVLAGEDATITVLWFPIGQP